MLKKIFKMCFCFMFVTFIFSAGKMKIFAQDISNSNIKITDWEYTKDADTIQLKSFHGSTSNGVELVIPNPADFRSAGAKNITKVKISRDVMETIADIINKNCGSLKISNTNNEKVIASNADWRDCFLEKDKITKMDLANLDTSNITNMQSMFSCCCKLTKLDVSTWNTSKVDCMSNTFSDCNSLNELDVSKWDTSNVTSMYGMFDCCKALKKIDVSKWNTSKVEDMTDMFSACESLTELDVSNWNTSNVKDMNAMFFDCCSLTKLDLSNWDTHNIIHNTNEAGLNCLFSNCHNLQCIKFGPKWVISNACGISSVFYNCDKLTMLDLADWDFNGCELNNARLFYVEKQTPLLIITKNEKLLNYNFAADNRIAFVSTFKIKGQDNLKGNFENACEKKSINKIAMTPQEFKEIFAAETFDDNILIMQVKSIVK